MIVQLRSNVTDVEGGVHKLESATTEIVKTLSTVTILVNGWKSDSEKIASRVDATDEQLVQLQKEVVQLRSEVAAKSSKRGFARSRTPLSRCHCSIVRFNRNMDRILQKGDEVWMVPRHGREPTLKRYVLGTNGRSSELSHDRAGRVRLNDLVRNEELFIKSVCQVCCRRR